MKTKTLLLLAALGLAGASAQAQITLVGWDFNGLSAYGSSPQAAGTVAPNLTHVGLTRGSGVTTSGTAASNAWGGTGWDSTTLANAITAVDLATFSITPIEGYEISISSISNYNVRRSGTGPTTGQWQYQVGAGSFNVIGSAITWGDTTTASGNAQSTINLSGISALQSLTETVTFRLVNWGASAAGGTWYLNNFQTGNDFSVLGTVAIPEPGTLVMVGLMGVAAVIGLRRRKK